MTVSLFLSRHADKWAQIKGDLLLLVDAQNPAHGADKLPLAVGKEQSDTLNANFTARLGGYAACRRVLDDLGEGFSDIETETATFTKSPEELLKEELPASQQSTMPAMPPPKNRRKAK